MCVCPCICVCVVYMCMCCVYVCARHMNVRAYVCAHVCALQEVY